MTAVTFFFTLQYSINFLNDGSAIDLKFWHPIVNQGIAQQIIAQAHIRYDG